MPCHWWARWFVEFSAVSCQLLCCSVERRHFGAQGVKPYVLLLLLQPCAGAEPEKGQRRKYQVGRVALRSVFFDSEIMRAISAGANQVVVLGAGMDCRAWRLDLPAGEGLPWAVLAGNVLSCIEAPLNE